MKKVIMKKGAFNGSGLGEVSVWRVRIEISSEFSPNNQIKIKDDLLQISASIFIKRLILLTESMRNNSYRAPGSRISILPRINPCHHLPPQVRLSMEPYIINEFNKLRTED